MGCLAGLLLLSACSSEENMADTGNKIDVAKGIRFQFTEEGFEPGEVAAAKQGTRAMAEPQEIDLGNGIIAEATLEPDTVGCAQTRAGNPVPDGTYKIYAIDAGGTRHDGLTGTMTGGVFTPSGHWELEAGTYTFVCINSAVTDNGNELYVNMGQGRFKENNDNPLIGVVPSVVVTNPNDVIVSFVMRHQQARVRYGFVSYTEPIENFDFDFDTDGDWGGDIYYDLQGNKLRNGTEYAYLMRKDHIPVHQNRAYAPSSLVTEYLHTTDYVYVSPDLKARVFANVNAGSIYGRTITTPRQYYFSLGTLQKNHSYIWKLKFKNKDPWYLYNDGTIGSLAKRGSRTPIGVVVKEKTNSEEGTAAGLHFISGYNWEEPSSNGDYRYTDAVAAQDPMKSMDGYKYTWDPTTDSEGLVKAEQQTRYPAFYQVGHYNPGVATSNIGKWYFPAMGEMSMLFDKFLEFDKVNAYNHYEFKKDINEIYKPFVAAGGDNDMFRGWSSSQFSKTFGSPIVFYIEGNPNEMSVRPQGQLKHGGCFIVPFVHF